MSLLFPEYQDVHLNRVIKIIQKSNIDVKADHFAENLKELSKSRDSFAKMSFFSWLHSFFSNDIDNNQNFRIRKNYVEKITQIKNQILSENFDKTDKFLLTHITSPSKTKIILLALFTGTMVLVACTGIGALIQLSALGGILACLVIGKLALTALTFFAAKFAICNIFLAAITTVSTSSFFACLSYRELTYSGDVFRFINMDNSLSKMAFYHHHDSFKEMLSKVSFVNKISTYTYTDKCEQKVDEEFNTANTKIPCKHFQLRKNIPRNQLFIISWLLFLILLEQ